MSGAQRVALTSVQFRPTIPYSSFSISFFVLAHSHTRPNTNDGPRESSIRTEGTPGGTLHARGNERVTFLNPICKRPSTARSSDPTTRAAVGAHVSVWSDAPHVLIHAFHSQCVTRGCRSCREPHLPPPPPPGRRAAQAMDWCGAFAPWAAVKSQSRNCSNRLRIESEDLDLVGIGAGRSTFRPVAGDANGHDEHVLLGIFPHVDRSGRAADIHEALLAEAALPHQLKFAPRPHKLGDGPRLAAALLLVSTCKKDFCSAHRVVGAQKGELHVHTRRHSKADVAAQGRTHPTRLQAFRRS
eukprot:5208148-Prymnesium_polylepis.1